MSNTNEPAMSLEEEKSIYEDLSIELTDEITLAHSMAKLNSDSSPVVPYVDVISHLKKVMVSGVLFVRFRKKNGDVREMFCSRRDSDIDSITSGTYDGGSRNARLNNAGGDGIALTVIDLEAKDWRAFRVDTIIECELVTPNRCIHYGFDTQRTADVATSDTTWRKAKAVIDNNAITYLKDNLINNYNNGKDIDFGETMDIINVIHKKLVLDGTIK